MRLRLKSRSCAVVSLGRALAGGGKWSHKTLEVSVVSSATAAIGPDGEISWRRGRFRISQQGEWAREESAVAV
jgi:hypothetical protein